MSVEAGTLALRSAAVPDHAPVARLYLAGYVSKNFGEVGPRAHGVLDAFRARALREWGAGSGERRAATAREAARVHRMLPSSLLGSTLGSIGSLFKAPEQERPRRIWIARLGEIQEARGKGSAGGSRGGGGGGDATTLAAGAFAAGDDRRLANAAEVHAMLRDYGYSAVDFAPLSLREKAEALATATHVATTNGAGVCNMLFSPSSAAWVVVSSPRFSTAEWWVPLFKRHGVPLAVLNEFGKRVHAYGNENQPWRIDVKAARAYLNPASKLAEECTWCAFTQMPNNKLKTAKFY